jgi:hypothetical protein
MILKHALQSYCKPKITNSRPIEKRRSPFPLLEHRHHRRAYFLFVQITNKMYQVLKTVFCHEALGVSGIFCAHHQELSAVHVAFGMFRAGYVAAA